MIFKKRTLIEINSKIAKEILKKKRLDKDYNICRRDCYYNVL